MMKRNLILYGCTVAILTIVGFVAGCENAQHQANPEVVQKNNHDTIVSLPTPAPLDSLAAAALEYCNCFRQSMGSLDPQVEQLIVKSASQPNPRRFLETELSKMTDLASQEQAIKDLETFSNIDAASPCVASVSKKYRLDETDPLTLQRIVRQLEKAPDCKLVTALFKIAYAQSNTQ